MGAEIIDICLPIDATEMGGRYEDGNWILLCFIYFFFSLRRIRSGGEDDMLFW